MKAALTHCLTTIGHPWYDQRLRDRWILQTSLANNFRVSRAYNIRLRGLVHRHVHTTDHQSTIHDAMSLMAMKLLLICKFCQLTGNHKVE
ncbi:hypothetical protein E4T45_00758 [Aureobasidium sp. EXF-8846]|nr:hypothetical protein E4T45_00758 [Aureobasidium sp. EXF-8846]